MTTEKKPMGRPPLPPGERLDARFEVRCTRQQREKLERLGGVEWLRKQIDKAREPT